MASEILYIPPAGGGSGDIAAVLATGSITAPDQQIDFLDTNGNLGTSILANVIQIESADGAKNIQLQVSADGTTQQITFGNGASSISIETVSAKHSNIITFPDMTGDVDLVQKTVVTVDVPYTISGLEKVIIVSPTQDGNVQLPDPTVFGANESSPILYIKRTDSGAINTIGLLAFGGENINGASMSSPLAPLQSMQLISDGTNWWIIN